MTDEDERELHAELARLQQEHRDLDAAIDALHHSPAPDLLRLQRLKKRKLQLKDRMEDILRRHRQTPTGTVPSEASSSSAARN